MFTKTWLKIISSGLLTFLLLVNFSAPISTPADTLTDPQNTALLQTSPGQSIVVGPFYPLDNSNLPPAPPFSPSSAINIGTFPTNLPLPKMEGNLRQPVEADPVVQNQGGVLSMPAPITNWEGISATGVLPPDTDGQVGPNHYVQIVNHYNGAWVRVWNKTGTMLYDFGLQDLWPSGNICRTNGEGDPVVLYDQIANRWILSQFVYPFPPAYECIAVSKGPTPTNVPSDWYVYSFKVSDTLFNDYPKLGVWPDGYYMMAHQFDTNFYWRGTGIWVFNRSAMLAGNPATYQYIDLFPVNPNYGGMLPANLLGNTLPPSGAPNYFVEVDQDWNGTNDIMTIFKAKVTWPSSFTFTVQDELVVAPFTWPVCSNYRGRCIHQPTAGPQLEGLADRLMMHAWYRNMGTYEVLVVNHTVNTGSNRAGIRWYEVRKYSGSNRWQIYQQGTYAPDSTHRWMGSIAMDRMGNMALGYSVSSETVYPGIRYTGRLATDPLGTMPQGEAVIINGSGVQTHSEARWGDYSAMSVDPVDDCTFWYTQEYIQTTGSANWQTRVASFKFPNCSAVPTGTLQGTILDATTSLPIPGATVQGVGSNPQNIFTTQTNSSGFYQINVPVDTYSVTASALGYMPNTINNVAISQGGTTVQNFALTPAPSYLVQGVVTDANTGWPLYASILIEGYSSTPIWTHPRTGQYQISLPGGTAFTFYVNAFSGGYLTEDRTIGPLTANRTENFALQVDPVTCSAPGYQESGGICDPLSGGLAVGNVFGQTTMLPINSATVSNQAGYSTLTVSTPDDSAVEDGFYILFSPSGFQNFTASKSGGYASDVKTVEVISNATVNQDFYLKSGYLTGIPDALYTVLKKGQTKTLAETLYNLGSLALNFEVLESGPVLQLSNKPLPNKTKSKITDVTPYFRYVESPLALGTELFRVDAGNKTGHALLLGIEYAQGYYWVTSGGQSSTADPNMLFKLDRNGNVVGSWNQGTSSAWGWRDLAYDGTYLYASDSNFLAQIDPLSGLATGVTIPCPDNPCRGLAYDPATDHFWTANFSNNLFEFNRSGTVLKSFTNSLSIYGLAWDAFTAGGPYLWAWSQDGTPAVLASQINPSTGAPTGVSFTGSSIPGTNNVAGGAAIINGEHPSYPGTLILVGMHQADSDTFVGYDLNAETNMDITWLNENPTLGTINGSSTSGVNVTFNTNVPEIPGTGIYRASLRINNDTPHGSFIVPVTMVVASSTSADLQIIKSGSTELVRIGENLVYTLRVTNNGPAKANLVKVVDTLPTGVTHVSSSSGCSFKNGKVTCNINQLNVGVTLTFTIVVRVNQLGTLINSVNVSALETDPYPSNNTATLSTQAANKIFVPIVIK